jgi:hypothetical protein
MELIFDNKLGRWPNSVQHNGSYFKNRAFANTVNIYEDSVYHGKVINRNKKYIYSIKVTPHFTNFTGTHSSGSKLNGEYFWKNISEEVLNDVRLGNATILLEWCNESVIDKNEFHSLNESLRHSGISKNQIILVMNGINAQEIYESWFPENERRFLVRVIPFLAHDISWYYANNKKCRLTESDFINSKETIRKHHFTFPNRRARPYRIYLLSKMFKNSLLEKGNWSLLSNENSHLFDTEFFIKLPHNLEEEPGIKFNDVSGNQDTSSEWNLTSYFYIASETFMHGEYRAFTEKIFKPLVNFQPFVFAAFTGALQELRNMGFKTFHPFIDETYDTVNDSNIRLDMIYREIEKLCSMTKKEIHNWYWNMEDILLHNHNHTINLYKNHLISDEFFRELGGRCCEL